MTQYCTNNNKAILTYIKPNDAQEVVVFKAPIEVTVEPGTANIWKYGGSGVGGGCQPTGNFEYTVEADNLTIGTESNNPVFPGCTYQVFFADGGQLYGAFYNAFMQKISNKKDCKIKVNREGSIIYEDTYKCGTSYTVACDNGCPAGQERIPTIEYPGYKCREKCPSETCCECDRGDIICCYGSNGQVLKTIRK